MERSVWVRKVNVFLLGIPIVLLGERFGLAEHIGAAAGFLTLLLSALSLIPLAGFLESAVEELAELLGPFLGGLLHTTASNIAELAIAVSVLLTLPAATGSEVVLGSIAGVIVRNSLLFLGLATLAGCLRNGRMKFNAENASEYSTIFALAVTGLSLPTLAHYVFGATEERIGFTIALFGRPHLVTLSEALSAVLLISYLAYIGFVVFHFREGRNLVERAARKRAERRREVLQRRLARAILTDAAPPLPPTQPDTQALFVEERERAKARLSASLQEQRTATAIAVAEREHAPEEEQVRLHARAQLLREKRLARAEARGGGGGEAGGEGEEHGFLAGHRLLRGVLAFVILSIATAGVAVMSESFAKSVETVLKSNPTLSHYEFFLGLAVIPVLAGMVELYGSVGMARRNRMEITMAVTAGASIQMILLVVPVLVLLGAFTGHTFDLLFSPLTVITFGAATFAFMLLSRDGESTLLEGAQLCALWLLLAVVAVLLPPV